MTLKDEERKLLQGKALEVFHVKLLLDKRLLELREAEFEVLKANEAFGKGFDREYTEIVELPDAPA